MNKTDQLKNLHQEMLADKSLPLKTNLVFGEGNADCEVLFIGEAPGAKEDELIRPFVGRSGQLLRKNIRELGWKEEDAYITNIVKRRPPENRDPLPEEITAYKPYLTRQIEIINPKVIVPLGRFSMNYFLPEAKITRDQGKLFEVTMKDNPPSQTGQSLASQPKATAGEGKIWFVAPMLHPSAALRGNTMMALFQNSFKNLPKILRKVDEMKTKRGD